MSYDNDDTWEQVEQELHNMMNVVISHRDTQERIILSILKHIESLLLENNIRQSELFTYISNILSYDICVNVIWDWLYNVYKRRKQDIDIEAIVIGVIEPATECPVSSLDLNEYMQHIDDKSFAYLLFDAYEREGFPENMLADYATYKHGLIERGLPFIEFPYAWLQEYLDEDKCQR